MSLVGRDAQRCCSVRCGENEKLDVDNLSTYAWARMQNKVTYANVSELVMIKQNNANLIQAEMLFDWSALDFTSDALQGVGPHGVIDSEQVIIQGTVADVVARYLLTQEQEVQLPSLTPRIRFARVVENNRRFAVVEKRRGNAAMEQTFTQDEREMSFWEVMNAWCCNEYFANFFVESLKNATTVATSYCSEKDFFHLR